MPTTTEQAPVERIDTHPRVQECLSCKVIGTGVLAGTGAYAIWQSRGAAPGSLGQKRIVAVLGVGKFAIGTIYNSCMKVYGRQRFLLAACSDGKGVCNSSNKTNTEKSFSFFYLARALIVFLFMNKFGFSFLNKCRHSFAEY